MADADQRELETVPIESLDAFVGLITAWHQNRVAQVKHMLEVPEGTEVSIREGETLVLEGEKLQAFRIGIHTTLSHLGELPFVAEVTDEAKP
jgi:hypothetical protein